MSATIADLGTGVSKEAQYARRQMLAHEQGMDQASLLRRRLSESLYVCCLEAAEPDWDGYGGIPVSYDSCRHAQSFIDQLPTRLLAHAEIAIEPDGEVAFEWNAGPGWMLSISVGPNNTLTIAGLFGESKEHGVERLLGSIPIAVGQALGRIDRQTLLGEARPNRSLPLYQGLLRPD